MYVIDPDSVECKWIESVLGRSVETVVRLESVGSLLADPPAGGAACLITSAEPGEQGALEILRSLRRKGVKLPVIALGSHTAFRTAVDIARMVATDFLERPISDRELRAAVRRACKGAARSNGKGWLASITRSSGVMCCSRIAIPRTTRTAKLVQDLSFGGYTRRDFSSLSPVAVTVPFRFTGNAPGSSPAEEGGFRRH